MQVKYNKTKQNILECSKNIGNARILHFVHLLHMIATNDTMPSVWSIRPPSSKLTVLACAKKCPPIIRAKKRPSENFDVQEQSKTPLQVDKQPYRDPKVLRRILKNRDSELKGIKFEKCPRQCTTLSNSGRKCVNFLSNSGKCGTSKIYRLKGTDCRQCAARHITTHKDRQKRPMNVFARWLEKYDHAWKSLRWMGEKQVQKGPLDLFIGVKGRVMNSKRNRFLMATWIQFASNHYKIFTFISRSCNLSY